MLGTAGNDAIMTDLSATSVIAMRNATKNIFYVTVNSAAYDSYTPGAIPDWMRTMYIVDGVLVVLIIVAEVLTIRNYQRKKKVPKVEIIG